MLKIYKPVSGLDWMNYKIVKKDMTAHHIIKAEHGGELSQDNVALLMDVSHRYLHLIECKDITAYNLLNKIFKMVNEQGHEPTQSQREIIEFILRTFEEENKDKKNAKGKTLIKEEYLKRGL